MKVSTISKIKKISITLLVALFWLTVWQAVSMLIDSVFVLVSPIQTAEALFKLSGQSMFWRSIFNSLWHIMAGFILAMLIGAFLAAICYRFKIFDIFLSPIVSLMKSVPVASLTIILFFLVSGKSISTVVAFIMVMPVFFINVFSGLKNTNPKLLELAKVYRMGFNKKLKYIYLPQILPFFFAALGTGLGFAWKSAIAAEVISIPKNTIGYGLYNAKISLETPDIFAWTVAIIVISVILEKLIKLLIARFSK